MKRTHHDILLKLARMLSIGLMTFWFAAGWYLYYGKNIVSPYYENGNYMVIVLYLILFIVFGRIYDAFDISNNRISEMAYSQSLAALIADAVMFIVICLLTKTFPNVAPMLIVVVMQCVFGIAWAYFANHWYYRTFPAKKTAIIYQSKIGMYKLIDEYGLSKKYDVQLVAIADDCINHLERLHEFETIFISGVHSRERNIILKYCIANDIEVMVLPRVGDVIMTSAKAMHLFHLPMLRVVRYNASPEYLFVKRLMDIVLSSIAIVVLSPFMLVVAIAIKAYDGGPVIYSQVRLTKDAKPFNIYKFRSMRVDAEKDGVARLSTGENDDRITPIGKVIRKCRFDELPQLFNIIAGDMSVCGTPFIIGTTKKSLIHQGFSAA